MKALAIGLLAIMCLAMTLLMPWAELGLPVYVPGTSVILGLFENLRTLLVGVIPLTGQDKNIFVYYAYSFFLGLALVFSAIAIGIVGREDAEEKTVLPVKK